jgi:flagellar motor switch protein FliN/FliY
MAMRGPAEGPLEEMAQAVSERDSAAQFPILEQDQSRKGIMRELDFLLDIPLEVSVELGKTCMIINDLLQLGQGSVIELNKLAGEPLEILVNSKLIARGEVVVINEKFGVRITDIISPIERVKQLA